jgi:hypothetical protein
LTEHSNDLKEEEVAVVEAVEGAEVEEDQQNPQLRNHSHQTP